MSDLRYKGKTYVGTNIQADKTLDLCFCTFVAVGEPMDDSKCKVHAGVYRCGAITSHGPCQCQNYKPNKEKKYPSHWPLCICGHIAQEH